MPSIQMSAKISVQVFKLNILIKLFGFDLYWRYAIELWNRHGFKFGELNDGRTGKHEVNPWN